MIPCRAFFMYSRSLEGSCAYICTWAASRGVRVCGYTTRKRVIRQGDGRGLPSTLHSKERLFLIALHLLLLLCLLVTHPRFTQTGGMTLCARCRCLPVGPMLFFCQLSVESCAICTDGRSVWREEQPVSTKSTRDSMWDSIQSIVGLLEGRPHVTDCFHESEALERTATTATTTTTTKLYCIIFGF